MDLGLRGKSALVTASSHGLGAACAEALAREGARVAICSRHRDEIEETANRIRKATGVEVLTFVADLSKPSDVLHMVEETVRTWGGLHVLVTNTGGPPPGRFDDLDDEKWRFGFTNTVEPVISLIRGVLPAMRGQRWGRIITLTSSSVKEPIDALTLSNSLRPAIHGLVKSLSREVAAEGITVNAIITGMFLTDRLRELAENRAERNGTSADQELEKMASAIPRGKLGDPMELAEVVAFLASQQARAVTGTAVVIDGGQTLGTTFG